MSLADLRVGLRAYLLDDAAIVAVVGARVFPVVLPQGEKRASIVYQRVSGLGDHHMQGPSGLARTRVQIDCWAEALDTAASLADLVKERLDGSSGALDWDEDSPGNAVVVQGIFFDTERESFDDAAKLFRVSRDYFVWYAER